MSQDSSLTLSSESPKKLPYRTQLKQDFSKLIEQIDLSPLQKEFMKLRWLDQVLWLEKKSENCQRRYYFLRMITIIGGVIVPALVSFKFSSNQAQQMLGWITLFLSQGVAISAAIEEFFHYGERFRHYRNTAEAMKIEGWQFFQLSGFYAQLKTHSQAYPDFAGRVESIIERDVEGYLSKVVQEKPSSQGKTDSISSSS
ncbi:conserved hypothetical protein [Gloeothece citriformis PCC 7424]|uniref:SMODS and SLOG-associating 2TM effector domain-containing protein n=1 Tax=Gloeothece citriformis (strain PCC 7424) TaxID=65393 RepID=B7K8D8_GLOC7|nr:DUF4231 domain-containing protein [Gloeothece citriformis]ACK69898.1 conserved hypothetical protein [Gloeothece citriformis PCC 7424]